MTPGRGLAVDEEVVDAERARRRADEGPPGGVRLELDHGGAGAHHEAHPRGLRLGQGQAGVGVLPACVGGEAVREHAAGGGLDLEGTAQQVGGDGGGDEVGGAHGRVLGVEGVRRAGAQRAAGSGHHARPWWGDANGLPDAACPSCGSMGA